MKKKEREFIKNIQYSENAIAKKILRKYKIERWIYYTIFLLLMITFILWSINIYEISSLIFCLAIYIIFCLFFTIRYKRYSEKLLKESLYTSICPEGFLNINIYNANKMLINKKAYMYALSKIATGYIELGEFEKAKEVIEYVEKRKININIKGEIIKNKINLAFLTNDIKEFSEQCEKMKSIRKFLSKRFIKENSVNMSIQEAIINKDFKKANELIYQLEKKRNRLNQIMVQYYKGLVLEKNSKDFKNEYKYIAEKGNNLYIAKQARKKLEIEYKDNKCKNKKHVVYKIINVISILIILIYMISILIYMKEEPNIKWNTGEVFVLNKELILPEDVKKFEEENQLEIKEIDENNFAEVKLGESTVLMYIKDNQIKGIKVDIDNINKADIDKIIFPNNVKLSNNIEEVKEMYNTGNVNIFMEQYNKRISEDKDICINRYVGKKYNVEIRSVEDKIQSILYVYKY